MRCSDTLGALAALKVHCCSTALGDQSAIVRATAARAVLSLDSDEAAGLLIPLLGDRDEFVRRETAYALGVTRSRRAVEPLITALGRDKNAGVRGAAAVALGQISDPSAVPALMETLGRRFPAPGLLNRIRGRKTEENEFVRRAAAVSLGRSEPRCRAYANLRSHKERAATMCVAKRRALSVYSDSAAVPLCVLYSRHATRFFAYRYEALRKINPSISRSQSRVYAPRYSFIRESRPKPKARTELGILAWLLDSESKWSLAFGFRRALTLERNLSAVTEAQRRLI